MGDEVIKLGDKRDAMVLADVEAIWSIGA